MNAARLCRDDLVVGARRGTLSPQDELSFEAHLERCAACRAAFAVGQDFDDVLGAQAGDDEIANRIAAAVAPVAKSARPARRRRTPLAIGLVAAAFFVASIAAAASRPAVWNAVFGASEAETPPSPAPEPRSRSTRSHAQPQLREPEDVEVERDLMARDEAPLAIDEPMAPPTRERALPDPDALFATANAARRSGEHVEARRLYLQLQRAYPRSVEALVSRVSLGRLLLERMGQPAAALPHFDAYLAQSTHTALAEEALFGRASALMRLGRRAQERAAWEQLLRRFPGSVYADRAHARLADAP
ncbi:MAG: tol-pal system YbgF family protein [Sandaracinaceae bacterium]